jgi:hypothetical protein
VRDPPKQWAMTGASAGGASTEGALASVNARAGATTQGVAATCRQRDDTPRDGEAGRGPRTWAGRVTLAGEL